MLSRSGSPTSQLDPPPGMAVTRPAEIVDSGAAARGLARGGLPPHLFRRVRDYVLAHLAEKVTNRALAEFVGLSTCYFTRAFKQSAGVAPHRFVLQSRIERVKHLLVQTNLPLSHIAIAAGFADQSHCARRFREFVGITPTRFRWLSR
jgi:transcriptional regulator GlxA family with amidase domain